jgi:two-component system, OmpR family, sensor kinase
MMRPSRPLSFRTRLTVRWTAVFSCVLAAASVAIFLGIRSASYAELDRHLRTLAGTEVASAFDQPVSPHVHELPTTALVGGRFTEKVVQIFDRSGRVVVSTRGQAAAPLVAPEVIAATLAGSAPVATIDAAGVPMRVVGLRKTHEGREYAFIVGVVIADFLAGLTRVKWLLALVWLVSAIATAAVGFALASTALRPVRHITQRALEIAQTGGRARLEPPTVQDEIGTMTRALNVLLERLHHALDANRRFAADAAHELRSPVTAMTGEIDVALRRDRTAGEYRDTLEVVRDRLTSLSSIISDLMVLVRAQESRDTVARHELSLHSVVQGSLMRLDSTATARRVSLTARDLEGFWIYGDAGLLGRVFDNVVENAIRYTQEGGAVRIDAIFTDAATGAWQAGQVTVRVSDDGPGIPAGDVERVFDRFYRVDASRNRHTGGAGLGLAIAREVLAVFEGTIRIERTGPDGTTVAIQLPGRAGSTDSPPERLDSVAAATPPVST